MTEPTITIAIPTYNRSDMLSNTMACMINQQTDGTFTYEILIIDDASTDNTRELVRQIIKDSVVSVRYIYEDGRGYTRVLNRAVKEFRGQWLAFFDDDQLTHSLWLKELFAVGVNENASIVGGPILLDLPESVLAGLGPVCRDLYGESPDVRDRKKYRKVTPLPSGGNRLVRRQVFECIGTFDESMLTGGCDRDFLLRAQAAGISMGWAPRAAASHIIPPERFTYKHIKWYSLQWGCSFAYIDSKRRGVFKTALLCISRIGQAFMINIPLLFLAKLKKDKAEILDRQALLWRAAGYARKTLQLIAPNFFAQEKFFSQVEFRRARQNT